MPSAPKVWHHLTIVAVLAALAECDDDTVGPRPESESPDILRNG